MTWRLAVEHFLWRCTYGCIIVAVFLVLKEVF